MTPKAFLDSQWTFVCLPVRNIWSGLSPVFFFLLDCLFTAGPISLQILGVSYLLDVLICKYSLLFCRFLFTLSMAFFAVQLLSLRSLIYLFYFHCLSFCGQIKTNPCLPVTESSTHLFSPGSCAGAGPRVCVFFDFAVRLPWVCPGPWQGSQWWESHSPCVCPEGKAVLKLGSLMPPALLHAMETGSE